jgi:hypothetical protein
MVDGVLLSNRHEFSDIVSLFFYTFLVLLFFSQVTHPYKLQLDQALRACYLEKVVSVQTPHYHVQTAKAKLKEKQLAHDDQVLLTVDCRILHDNSAWGSSSTCRSNTLMMSPLTKGSSFLPSLYGSSQQPTAASEFHLVNKNVSQLNAKFNLKDLPKKDTIIAKLQSLERDRTYQLII